MAMQGVLWLGGQRFAARVLDQVFNIVLVRLLLPSDYGVLALAWIAVGFLGLLTEVTAGSAIVQRREVDDEYLSTAFWSGLIVGIVLFAVAAAASPFVGALLAEPRAVPITIALSTHFVLFGLWATHVALATRRMDYRALAVCDAVAVVVAGLTGIGMAFAGMGVWSLVGKFLASSVVAAIGYPLAARWRPSLRFSWAKLADLWSFGTPLMLAKSFGYFIRNLDNLLIGRFLGSAALGYYALAYTAFRIPLQDVAAPLHQVMFSALSRVQEDTERLRRALLVATQYVAIVALPVMVGLALVAPQVIEVVFGERWLPSASVLSVLALAGAFQLVTTLWFSGLQAAGRPDLQLRWTALSALLYLPAFAVGLRWGIVGVAAGYLAATAMLVPIQYRFVAQVLGVTARDLWGAVRASLIGCATMAVVAALTARALASFFTVVVLVLTVTLGGIVYGAVMLAIERRAVVGLVVMVRENLRRTGRRRSGPDGRDDEGLARGIV